MPVSPPTGASASVAPRPSINASDTGTTVLLPPARPNAAAPSPKNTLGPGLAGTLPRQTEGNTRYAGVSRTRPADGRTARLPRPHRHCLSRGRRESAQPGVAHPRSSWSPSVRSWYSPQRAVLPGCGSMEQYYIGVDGDQVTIFQGVRGDVLGLPLHDVVERTDLNIDQT